MLMLSANDIHVWRPDWRIFEFKVLNIPGEDILQDQEYLGSSDLPIDVLRLSLSYQV